MSSKIILWKWKSDGWRKGYTATHVNNMVNMLKRHTTVPLDIVCVTDDPRDIQCETYPLWKEPLIKVGAGRPNCYKRLFLYSDEAKQIFGDRVISIDIDTLITANIDDIVTYDEAPFKAMEGNCAPYNGSLWSLKTGVFPHIWTDFNQESPKEIIRNTKRPNGRPYYGSDQAWMSYKLGTGHPTWGASDGVYQFHSGRSWHKLPENFRMMFAAGGTKFWDASMNKLYPNLYNLYKENTKPC